MKRREERNEEKRKWRNTGKAGWMKEACLS